MPTSDDLWQTKFRTHIPQQLEKYKSDLRKRRVRRGVRSRQQQFAIVRRAEEFALFPLGLEPDRL